MRIKSIYQINLRNEEVFRFMGSTITLIETADEAVETAVEPVIDSLKNVYSRFDAVLERIQRRIILFGKRIFNRRFNLIEIYLRNYLPGYTLKQKH